MDTQIVRISELTDKSLDFVSIARADLPTELPPFDRRAYLRALQVDKKRREREIRFVALRRIGRARVISLRPAEILPPGSRGRRSVARARGAE